jgi:hypothetical protein
MYGTAMMGLLGGGSGGGNLFAATSYVGNGSTQSIVTGQNQSAGVLDWIKETNSTAAHNLFDTSRGALNTLQSNSANAENNLTGSLTAFNSNGFSVGNNGTINQLSDTYVAFSWLEQAGYMDIVTYTGNGTTPRNISHSLAATPKLIAIKQRSDSGSWVVGHESATWTKWGQLQDTAAFQNATSEWNNTAPTSSVFTVGNSPDVNYNGGTYVAYLFAEKAGKSKFGSYTGNNTTQSLTGFGFAPKAVLAKSTSLSEDWYLMYKDGTSTYFLRPNTSEARGTPSGSMALNSDGFTVDQTSNGFLNLIGQTYIYAALG